MQRERHALCSCFRWAITLCVVHTVISVCNVDVSQRMHEERRALFSCFYWAAYAWNRQQLPAAGPLPDQTFWTALLVILIYQ